jgi:hypothetical protein
MKRSFKGVAEAAKTTGLVGVTTRSEVNSIPVALKLRASRSLSSPMRSKRAHEAVAEVVKTARLVRVPTRE